MADRRGDVTCEDFYAGMAPRYSLFFHDWDASVREQGRLLDRLVSKLCASQRPRVLDAACGIGTQAIGLALAGYHITASDLSEDALRRADDEARRFGVELTFTRADMRTLSETIHETFDVAIVMDNSLAHLLTQDDLCAAISQLRSVLRPDGVLIASIRDYEPLRRERPQFTSHRVIDHTEGRRVVFQVWDWSGDGEHYDLTQYLVRHLPDGAETHTFSCRIRALMTDDLSDALRHAGFSDVTWFDGEDVGYYQPVVTARG